MKEREDNDDEMRVSFFCFRDRDRETEDVCARVGEMSKEVFEVFRADKQLSEREIEETPIEELRRKYVALNSLKTLEDVKSAQLLATFPSAGRSPSPPPSLPSLVLVRAMNQDLTLC